MGNVRPSNKDAHDPLLKYGPRRRRSPKKLWKCCTVTTIIIFTLLLLLFLVVFVGLPLVLKYSLELQRNLIFPTGDLWPPNPDFNDFRKYNIEGVRNLYVLANEAENITLGVWHVLPEALLNNSMQTGDYDYDDLLHQPEFPVVIHFHGNGGSRVADLDMYKVLRMFFHIIAFDYRGYADSTDVKPTEEGIVQDSMGFYKWVRAHTDADIYFWGHSLGAALATHTAARLRDKEIVPTGLFLEAPFSNLEDEINSNPLSKGFSWLPWYKSTILQPLEENGFRFRTTDHILKVDCPIMIVHAEDDENIPYTLGEKLYRVAQEKRDPSVQGNVTLHLLPAHLECGHVNIYNAPELPNYIRQGWKSVMEAEYSFWFAYSEHIATCEEYGKGRG